MGLSTKQVSSGWNQGLLQASNLELPNNPMKRQSSSQQQQGDQQLKCPRCESTNTKFCYYNNYNKSQPRHFCKACKRHWTKGGTLRNVPIGGGRKNKRKSSKTTMRTATKTSYSTSKVASNNTMTIQGQQLKLNMKITSPRVVDDDNEKFIKGFNESKDGVYVGPQDLHYQYSNLGNFESLSSTISSLQSPNTQVYSSLEETMMNNNMLISSSWSMGVSPTSNNNWGWDSFDKFASVDADLISIPWDDLEIKP